MKKTRYLLYLLIIFLVFAGCSSNSTGSSPDDSQTTEQQSTTTEPETTVAAKVDITDYTLNGLMNVTDVYFCGPLPNNEHGYYGEVDPKSGRAEFIVVDIMCPYCHEMNYGRIEFSDISEKLIGQNSFTWEDSVTCTNWARHESSWEDDISFTVLFLLNG